MPTTPTAPHLHHFHHSPPKPNTTNERTPPSTINYAAFSNLEFSVVGIVGRLCWVRLRAKMRVGPKDAVTPPWSGGRTVGILYISAVDGDPNAAKSAVSSSLCTDARREIRVARSSGEWAASSAAVPSKARKSPFGSKPKLCDQKPICVR